MKALKPNKFLLAFAAGQWLSQISLTSAQVPPETHEGQKTVCQTPSPPEAEAWSWLRKPEIALDPLNVTLDNLDIHLSTPAGFEAIREFISSGFYDPLGAFASASHLSPLWNTLRLETGVSVVVRESNLEAGTVALKFSGTPELMNLHRIINAHNAASKKRSGRRRKFGWRLDRLDVVFDDHECASRISDAQLYAESHALTEGQRASRTIMNGQRGTQLMLGDETRWLSHITMVDDESTVAPGWIQFVLRLPQTCSLAVENFRLHVKVLTLPHDTDSDTDADNDNDNDNDIKKDIENEIKNEDGNAIVKEMPCDRWNLTFRNVFEGKEWVKYQPSDHLHAFQTGKEGQMATHVFRGGSVMPLALPPAAAQVGTHYGSTPGHLDEAYRRPVILDRSQFEGQKLNAAPNGVAFDVSAVFAAQRHTVGDMLAFALPSDLVLLMAEKEREARELQTETENETMPRLLLEGVSMTGGISERNGTSDCLHKDAHTLKQYKILLPERDPSYNTLSDTPSDTLSDTLSDTPSDTLSVTLSDTEIMKARDDLGLWKKAYDTPLLWPKRFEEIVEAQAYVGPKHFQPKSLTVNFDMKKSRPSEASMQPRIRTETQLTSRWLFLKAPPLGPPLGSDSPVCNCKFTPRTITLSLRLRVGEAPIDETIDDTIIDDTVIDDTVIDDTIDDTIDDKIDDTIDAQPHQLPDGLGGPNPLDTGRVDDADGGGMDSNEPEWEVVSQVQHKPEVPKNGPPDAMRPTPGNNDSENGRGDITVNGGEVEDRGVDSNEDSEVVDASQTGRPFTPDPDLPLGPGDSPGGEAGQEGGEEEVTDGDSASGLNPQPGDLSVPARDALAFLHPYTICAAVSAPTCREETVAYLERQLSAAASDATDMPAVADTEVEGLRPSGAWPQ